MRPLALLVVGLVLGPATAHAEPAGTPTELFYVSGGARIQAHLYRPAGDGPFPAVVYNHGSRQGRERDSMPFAYVGALLEGAGYVVLVPERRGYGRSDGVTWSQAVGHDGRRVVPRLQEETDDVVAAADHLRTLPFVDPGRIGVMGWSLGGIVTMLATGRGPGFAAAVHQAGGALMWNGNPDLQHALAAAAEKTTTPTLLLVAQNDRTTASITTLGAILERRGVPHRTVIYPPFSPRGGTLAGPAPGHGVFAAQGVHVWERDVLDFLARHLNRPSR